MSIKLLPEALRSSVRSGIILFDLTRVVAELIFNSLDAGATKVSVAVSVGTCYVKVVDNGAGISRDGLVLLGERYATSKFDQLTDIDAASGSFGFRGEALGSISDVSLLEIVSKAHGRPNGYRKVIKGCKCLYLGIDDDRQDVGTTVIVRDLFYNQPVRRNHLQSSEDELLCTYPSDSPLPLLRSGFGIDISSSLHEIVVSNGDLKISGYISGPCEILSVKAFQYFYINSRFIWKCPIHKLLNQLASKIDGSDLLKVNVSRNGKRSRSQTYTAYILNLTCPRSQYDLTFEPSKTSVEFKDWDPILRFIEKAIEHFWSKDTSSGDLLRSCADIVGKDDTRKEDYNILSLEEDFPTDSRISRKRCRTLHSHEPFELASPHLKMLLEDSKHMSACRNSRFSFQNSYENSEIGFSCQNNYSLAPSKATVNVENDNHLWAPVNGVPFAEDQFLENVLNIETPDEDVGCTLLDPRWDDTDFDADANMSRRLMATPNEDVECSLLDPRWDDTDLEVDANMSRRLTVTPNEDVDCTLLDPRWDDTDLEADANMGRRLTVTPNKDVECTLLDPRWDGTDLEADANKGHQLTVRELSTDYFKALDNVAGSSGSHKKFSMRSCSFMRNMQSDRAISINDDGFEFQIDGFRTKKKLRDNDYRTDIEEAYNDNQSIELWDQHDVYLGPPKSLPIHRSSNSGFGTFIDKDMIEGRRKYDRDDKYNFFADTEEKNCLSSSRNFSCDLNDILKGDIFDDRRNHDDVMFPKGCDEIDWNYDNMCAVPSYVDEDENRTAQIRCRDRTYDCEKRQRRSHSAPPFYIGKKKFFGLTSCSTVRAQKPHFDSSNDGSVLQETSDLRNGQKLCGEYHLSTMYGSVSNSLHRARPHMKRAIDNNEIQDCKMLVEGECLRSMSFQDLKPIEIEDTSASRIKWRNSSQQSATVKKLRSEDTSILDVSSGILHLAVDSLVPKSISKNCLKDAKVLPQIDRKFIPVVAGGILAIIDQHAADERIRLEELRHKVLCGEMKTITYLDAEQELILPEMGYQLLQNYAEQVQNWGWICNVNSQNSRSFKRNLNLLHRQPAVSTLVAVPCILGVNLTDADLLEFLQQLSDTNGSSAIPPSVLRILNSKACRGAIMFGDRLMPSECSLIVEELNQTSLCFQCAHGRPTTVPLVNLEMLHKQIAKLGLLSAGGGGGSNESWHGLHRHELNLERTAQRLRSAGGHC